MELLKREGFHLFGPTDALLVRFAEKLLVPRGFDFFGVFEGIFVATNRTTTFWLYTEHLSMISRDVGGRSLVGLASMRCSSLIPSQ